LIFRRCGRFADQIEHHVGQAALLLGQSLKLLLLFVRELAAGWAGCFQLRGSATDLALEQL
jgi:hypothetical protein